MASIHVDSLDIRQDTSARKFYFNMKGGEEAYLKYELDTDKDPNVVEFTELHIPEVLEGVGLEDEFAQEGIKYVDINKFKMKPKCGFMQGFMNRHPEYDYLRA